MTDILTLLQVLHLLPPPNPIDEAASIPDITTCDVEKKVRNDNIQTIAKHKDLLSMSVQELK